MRILLMFEGAFRLDAPMLYHNMNGQFRSTQKEKQDFLLTKVIIYFSNISDTLIFTTPLAKADDKLVICFLIFPRKKLTLNANCLHWRLNF